MPLPVATIGFTKTTAEHFFERLRQAQVKRVLDVRLHNTSQLAGFAKADNLAWFLRVIGGMEYVHELLLAPTDEILRPYKSGKGKWEDYAARFLALMAERRVEERLPRALFDGACLLCSEHRRAAATARWCATISMRSGMGRWRCGICRNVTLPTCGGGCERERAGGGERAGLHPRPPSPIEGEEQGSRAAVVLKSLPSAPFMLASRNAAACALPI